MNGRKNQTGVALIAAIFLVVIIGAAVVMLSVLSSRSNQQITQTLLQKRAQLAASSAIDYGVQGLITNSGPSCIASQPVSVPAYSDYSVTLSCTAAIYNRPSQRITLYSMSAIVEYGAPNNPDYVWTKIDATVEL